MAILGHHTGAHLCYGNEFYLHVYCHANKANFHNKGCAPGLVLKQRQKATWKWPILTINHREHFPKVIFSTYPLSYVVFTFLFAVFIETFPEKPAWISNDIAVGVLVRS